MTRLLSSNITSPIGMDTESNFRAIVAGKSMLREYCGLYGVPDKITASLFDSKQIEQMAVEGFSRFESLVFYSVSKALASIPSGAGFDLASERTVFILGTTKADIENLENNPGEYSSPGASAKKIARRLGFTTEPIVVCNACISGVSAQVLADRLIGSGCYDYAVVCGADCQSLFTMAGFLSFKAMSATECRPFDIERNGLNLGECAATMVLSGNANVNMDGGWEIAGSHLDNDSYHISAPSPDGEGVLRAINAAVAEELKLELSSLCVHGTATMFNDQMESKAVSRAGLSQIPVMAFKGVYGHTLGASGVLETILGLRSIDEGIIPAVRGFEEPGVSGKMNISGENRLCDKQKRYFLKIISGFGGCNGAVLWRRTDGLQAVAPARKDVETKVLCHVQINEHSAFVDGKQIETSSTGKALLTELYRMKMDSYPKFFKMDPFSKLVLVASDLLLQNQSKSEDTAVILFNASSSIVADKNHLSCIWNEDQFLPSPSAFIYTLPNIATGEVAIKHGFKAETTLYILNQKDDSMMDMIIQATFAQSGCQRMISGWVDCSDADIFEADLKLITL